MPTEIIKSERLVKFLEKKGLKEKFDFEVKKWNPKSFQNKNYDSIIGSFRFLSTTDGALFWQAVNEEFEWEKLNSGSVSSNNIEKAY